MWICIFPKGITKGESTQGDTQRHSLSEKENPTQNEMLLSLHWDVVQDAVTKIRQYSLLAKIRRNRNFYTGLSEFLKGSHTGDSLRVSESLLENYHMMQQFRFQLYSQKKKKHTHNMQQLLQRLGLQFRGRVLCLACMRSHGFNSRCQRRTTPL